MKKQKETLNYILLFTSIAILASMIIISLFLISISDNNTFEKKEEDVIKMVNDTITPPGLKQAVAVEVKRIHKRGIEDLMRQVGNKWKQSPSYSFTIKLHDADWESNTITNWDTGYVRWETYRYLPNETSEVTVTFTMGAGNTMGTTQLYVGEDNVPKAAPGTYGHLHEGLNKATSDSYEVTVDPNATSMKIVAHADVCGPNN